MIQRIKQIRDAFRALVDAEAWIPQVEQAAQAIPPEPRKRERTNGAVAWQRNIVEAETGYVLASHSGAMPRYFFEVSNTVLLARIGLRMFATGVVTLGRINQNLAVIADCLEHQTDRKP